MKTLIGSTPGARGTETLRRGVTLAALMVCATGAADRLLAQEQAGAGQPERREHVVRRGDTLWDLAGFYLDDPFLWPSLWEVNRNVVENPHWIYPEERLVIPPVPPVAADQAAAPDTAAVPGEVAGATVQQETGAARTQFFGYGGMAGDDGAAAGVVEAFEEEPPVRLRVQPGEFYAAPWLGEPDALPVVARYVGAADRHGQDRLPQTAHPRDAVYLSYAEDSEPEVGQRLLLVRLGRRVRGAGRVIEPTAILRVTSLEREVLAAVVERQFESVLPGQLALPLEAFPAEALAQPPQPVDDGPEGVLLDFLVEQPLYATTDEAFVSLGREQGIAVGDELLAFRPERMAQTGGVQEPAEPIARLKVVRVGDNSATVRVIQVTHAVLEPGLRVRLVSKMP